MKKIIEIKAECRQIIAINQPEFKGGKNDIFKPDHLPALPRWRSPEKKPEDFADIIFEVPFYANETRKKVVFTRVFSGFYQAENDLVYPRVFGGQPLAALVWTGVKRWIPLAEIMAVIE